MVRLGMEVGYNPPNPPTFSFSKIPTGGDSGESGGRCDSGKGIAGTVCVWGCVHICVWACVVCYFNVHVPEKQATGYSQIANLSSATAQLVWMSTSGVRTWLTSPTFFCRLLCVCLCHPSLTFIAALCKCAHSQRALFA